MYPRARNLLSYSSVALSGITGSNSQTSSDLVIKSESSP